MLFLLRTLSFHNFTLITPKYVYQYVTNQNTWKKDTDSAVSFRLLIYQFIYLFIFFNLWKFWLNSCYHQPHVHVTQTLSNFPWKFKSRKAQVRFGMKCTIIWHPVPRILINGNIWANDVPITQKSPSLVTNFFSQTCTSVTSSGYWEGGGEGTLVTATLRTRVFLDWW